MTEPNDPNKTAALNVDGTPSVTSRLTEEVCASCGGPMRLRNAKPFPVLLQTIFGVSFLAFLYVQGTGKLSTQALWAWSILQVAIGVLLVRARYASSKKVFICLRC